MRKFVSLVTALVFGFALCGATACGGNPEPNEIRVFSMPSTVKVTRDGDYSAYVSETPELEFEGARNEYESRQIILNPSKDVSAYTFETRDLTCGEDRIAKENVQVFFQRYVEVKRSTPTASALPKGFYPDALIPMSASVAAGENKVAAGCNQGIWITVYVPKNTPAGIYRSEFTLVADGERRAIPVSYEVWDFELGDEQHAKTVFTTTQEWLMQGELDNTDEMYEKYIDFLLGYRVSTIDLPNDDNLEDFIAGAKKYAADPRASAFQIPLVYRRLDKADFPTKPDGSSYGAETDPEIDYQMFLFDEEVFGDYIRAMIENSAPGLNLFSKAVCYPGSLDEAHAHGLQTNCKYFSMRMTDVLILIAAEYSAEELEAHGLTREDIVGLDMLYTIPYSADTEGLRGYCPLISDYRTQHERENYERLEKATYPGYDGSAADCGNMWWYFCNNPKAPYPTFHMDAHLVGGRVMPWMMYDYGIEGVLAWGTAVYVDVGTAVASRDYYEPRDPYEDCEVFWDSQGDGYFVYPGAKYGIDGPLPSIRLMTLRDGLEDYEYLHMLGALTEQYTQAYAIANYDLDSALENIYATLYTDVVFDTDFNKVCEARRQVAELLRLIGGEAHALVNVDRIDVVNQTATVSVYAAEGCKLSVNGAPIAGAPSGTGVRFQYTLQLDQTENVFRATLKAGEKEIEISQFVSHRVGLISDFGEADAADDWTTYADGETEYVTLSVENESLKIVCAQNTSDNTFYKPGFAISKQAAFGDLSLTRVQRIEMTIRNASAQEVALNLILETKTGSTPRQTVVKTVALKSGENRVVIENVSGLRLTAGLDAVSALAFKFPNAEKGACTLYLDDLFYTYC